MASQQCNLIINYIPQKLTDQEFTNLFEGIGPTKSCRIIRDKASNYSFGYGFVDYESPDDAAKAIETLNGLELQNKRIKVAFSRKHDKMDQTQLYITNFPKSYSQDQLQEICESYGQVINARLLADPNTGESKGIGFVLYDKNDEAAAGLAGLNGMTLEGQTLTVRYVDDFYNKHKQKNFRPPRGFESNNSVGGFGDNGGFQGGYDGGYDGGFQQYGGYGGGFQESSGYNSGSMGGRGGPMRRGNRGGGMGNQGQRFNPMGGNNRGRGSNRGGMGGGGSNNAIPALVSYPIHALGGKYQPSQSGQNQASGDGNGVTLYVYNIGPDTDENGLWQLFAPFGTIVKVDVIRDYTKNKGKGYGFVTMGSYDQAEAAIQGRHSFLFNGKPLQVRHHTPKNK